MLRKYPLTTLFIIATICVDVVILFTDDRGSALLEDSGPRFYLYNFALPAQFSTLAIWTVIGSSQLLVRAAWVTLAFGCLLQLTWVVEAPDWSSDHTACNFIQFITVLCGTALLRWCGLSKPTNAKSPEPIRFSLIELFGWTMIVALWAFALRYALGEWFIVDAYLIVWIVVASISPMLLVPVLFSQLSTVWRLLWLTILYLMALVAYIVGSNFMDGPMPLWAFTMAVTQITYISAWWAVMRMDEAMQERQAVSEASREKLKVFEPDPR